MFNLKLRWMYFTQAARLNAEMEDMTRHLLKLERELQWKSRQLVRSEEKLLESRKLAHRANVKKELADGS